VAQFSALRQESAQLYMHWSQFVELFATNSERVDLLKSPVPGSFATSRTVFGKQRCSTLPGLPTSRDQWALKENRTSSFKICLALSITRYFHRQWCVHHS